MEAQRTFFDNESDERDDDTSMGFNGVYLHGIDAVAENRCRPAFATVRFPNKKFSGYIGDGVNLWAAFPDIVGQFVDVKNGLVEAAPVKPRQRPNQEQA
jgi:hypothetical protein